MRKTCENCKYYDKWSFMGLVFRDYAPCNILHKHQSKEERKKDAETPTNCLNYHRKWWKFWD